MWPFAKAFDTVLYTWRMCKVKSTGLEKSACTWTEKDCIQRVGIIKTVFTKGQVLTVKQAGKAPLKLADIRPLVGV